MLDHTKPYSILKKYTIAAELEGHVHKRHVKLQSLCGSGFSLFAVRILATFCHFGVNWPTTLYENKNGVQYCVILQMVILH